MLQCRQCHDNKWDWAACPGVPEWFNPAVIYYCPHQVEWILKNLNMLKAGYWPPEPRETGYYDTGGKKLRRGNAYFTIPICVESDVTSRLDQCGKDGLIARQCLSEGWDEATLAEIMGRPLYVIEAKIRRVIKYCSGGRAKRISYYEFTRRRRIAEANHGF